MNKNDSGVLSVLLICLVIALICLYGAGIEVGEKQNKINELENRIYQQIELIDALQQ